MPPPIIATSIASVVSVTLISSIVSRATDPSYFLPVLDELSGKIRSKTVRAGVIGLGYVGLPLAVEFAKVGVKTVGFDVDKEKVNSILHGKSYISDIESEVVSRVVNDGTLVATTDFSLLADVDTINICVPTPLRKTKDPDLSYVVKAVEQIAAHLRSGQLIILESTTYPGTVTEVVQPRLEKAGLRVGADFSLAFSPERVDPGNAEWMTRNIPKVVGGTDSHSTELAAALYNLIVETVVPVSSTRVAEMVKLLENTFRAVNIGLVNELALMCRDLDVDVWEVIDAAKTKPFGFMPFYPGPGLGGHCIPIDPFYLSWKARQNGFESRFIELAGHVNASMPRYVVERVAEALNSRERSVRGSRVHLCGIAYKANVGDVRESPSIDIANLLIRQGANVSYSDPHVAVFREAGLALDEVPLKQALEDGVDVSVITTDHDGFDYDAIVRLSPVVVDTRNSLRGIDAEHIFRL